MRSAPGQSQAYETLRARGDRSGALSQRGRKLHGLRSLPRTSIRWLLKQRLVMPANGSWALRSAGPVPSLCDPHRNRQRRVPALLLVRWCSGHTERFSHLPKVTQPEGVQAGVPSQSLAPRWALERSLLPPPWRGRGGGAIACSWEGTELRHGHAPGHAPAAPETEGEGGSATSAQTARPGCWEQLHPAPPCAEVRSPRVSLPLSDG